MFELKPTYSGLGDGGAPRAAQLVELVPSEGEQKPCRREVSQETDHPASQRNLPLLAAGGLAVSHKQQLAWYVDVLCELREEFAPAHSRIQGSDDERFEMRGGRV